MKYDLTRRLAAEALGTFILVMAGVGSGIMAQSLAGDNEALALLCNSLATCAALFVLITAFIHLSGAHINPAVSLALMLRGALPAGEVLPYVAVQVIGGLLGAVVAHVMFGLEPLQISQHARTGTGQWLGEFIATFGLVGTILACVRFNPGAIAGAVALYILSAYWFTSSTSFANPAVTIARAISNTYVGIAPGHVLGFVVAQLMGAAVAVPVFSWLLRAPRDAAEG